MSLKSASPITLLSSQVLGHTVASLNRSPQTILGIGVAPKAYRPLREGVAVRTRKAKESVQCWALPALWIQRCGCPLHQQIVFLCVMLGSEPGDSLAQARMELFTGQPQTGQQIVHICYKMGFLGSQTHREQWGTVSSDKHGDLGGTSLQAVPSTLLYPGPRFTHVRALSGGYSVADSCPIILGLAFPSKWKIRC